MNVRLFPPPSEVGAALVELYATGVLLQDIQSSYYRLLVGFGLGGLLGIGMGLLTGRSGLASAILSPLINLLRPLPPVAIIPLVIVWLGIEDSAKIFSIAFAVFFPVWMSTHLGAAMIPQQFLWSAQLLSASWLRTGLLVIIPACLPSIVAGLRVAIAIAFVMVYVSEIAGASSGVGYRISISHLAYRIDTMMAALIVLAGAGAFADWSFSAAVRWAFPWTRT